MSDIKAISYNPATFRKDYDNIKAERKGAFLLDGQKYQLEIQPDKGKYITDTATNVTVEYKNRHEVKKWFGDQKVLQEKFESAKNLESISANLETLKSIKFEALDNLINASSDEEKEAAQEKIASYKNAASELSKIVNNPKCPVYSKIGFLKK